MGCRLYRSLDHCWQTRDPQHAPSTLVADIPCAFTSDLHHLSPLGIIMDVKGCTTTFLVEQANSSHPPTTGVCVPHQDEDADITGPLCLVSPQISARCDRKPTLGVRLQEQESKGDMVQISPYTPHRQTFSCAARHVTSTRTNGASHCRRRTSLTG